MPPAALFEDAEDGQKLPIVPQRIEVDGMVKKTTSDLFETVRKVKLGIPHFQGEDV